MVEELNKQKLEAYEKRKAQWQIDRANYLERKVSYERRKLEHEEYLANRLLMGDDPNDADDDDVDDEDRPIVKKGLQEPEYIPDVFPEFVPIGEVLNQMWDEDRIQTIEDLDIDYVPFEIAVLTIPDDYYWERASNEKWDVRVIKLIFMYIFKLIILLYSSTFWMLMIMGKNGGVYILKGPFGKHLKVFIPLMEIWKIYSSWWILLHQKSLKLSSIT